MRDFLLKSRFSLKYIVVKHFKFERVLKWSMDAIGGVQAQTRSITSETVSCNQLHDTFPKTNRFISSDLKTILITVTLWSLGWVMTFQKFEQIVSRSLSCSLTLCPSNTMKCTLLPSLRSHSTIRTGLVREKYCQDCIGVKCEKVFKLPLNYKISINSHEWVWFRLFANL